MSLAIDVDLVREVLLADGWHEVLDASFGLDAYEFLWSGRDGVTVREVERQDPRARVLTQHGGGQSGICATGFQFRSPEGWMSGPLTSVLAVRHAAADGSDG